MKKILVILITMSLVLSLVACGDSDTNETDSQGDKVSSNADVTGSDYSEPAIDFDALTEEIVRNYETAPASDFEYKEIAAGIKIKSYIGDDLIVVIPDTINGKPVVELAGFLFSNECPVKGVYIPKTVKDVGTLFANNDDVQVVICEGAEKAGRMTFGNCSSLHTLVLGENLKELGEMAFMGCVKLENLYIPETLETIDDNAFYACANITITGKAGSVIESYCKTKNIPFQAK